MPIEQTVVVGKEGINSKGIPAHTHFHKDLLGLTADDHIQYFNQQRLDNYLLSNHYLNNLNNAGNGFQIFKQLSNIDQRIAILRSLEAGTGITLTYSPDGNSVVISSTGSGGGGGGGTGVFPLFDAIVDGANDFTSTPPHYATVYDAIQAGKRSILIVGNITEANNIDLSLGNTVTSGVFIYITQNSLWDLGSRKITCGTSNFVSNLHITGGGTIRWENTDDTPVLQANNGTTVVGIERIGLINASNTTPGSNNIGNCLDCNLLFINNVTIQDLSNPNNDPNTGVKFTWGFRGLIFANNVVVFTNPTNAAQSDYTVFYGLGFFEDIIILPAAANSILFDIQTSAGLPAFLKSINIMSQGKIRINGDQNIISNISSLNCMIEVTGSNNIITDSSLGNGGITINTNSLNNIISNTRLTTLTDNGTFTHISNVV